MIDRNRSTKRGRQNRSWGDQGHFTLRNRRQIADVQRVHGSADHDYAVAGAWVVGACAARFNGIASFFTGLMIAHGHSREHPPIEPQSDRYAPCARRAGFFC